MGSQNRSIVSARFPGGHRNPPPRSQTEERYDRTTGVAASLPLQTAHRDDRDLRGFRIGHLLFTIPLIFSEEAASIGAWYPPFLAASAAVGAACTVGFWLMRRWAVYLYTGVLCLTHIVLLAMGSWNIVALLIPLAVVIIGYIYLPRME